MPVSPRNYSAVSALYFEEICARTWAQYGSEVGLKASNPGWCRQHQCRGEKGGKKASKGASKIYVNTRVYPRFLPG